MNGRTEAEDMEREYQRQSLRDTFAAAALTGLMFHNHEPPMPVRWWVEQAYDYADAMLRERSRTGQKLAESDSFCAVCPERDKTSAETHNVSGSVTLTDAEREAVEVAAEAYADDHGERFAATLRGLLERMK